MMGFTRCYKTEMFLHFMSAVFQSRSIAEILLLAHLESNERHMEILLPVSILNFLSSSAYDSAPT